MLKEGGRNPWPGGISASKRMNKDLLSKTREATEAETLYTGSCAFKL